MTDTTKMTIAHDTVELAARWGLNLALEPEKFPTPAEALPYLLETISERAKNAKKDLRLCEQMLADWHALTGRARTDTLNGADAQPEA